jgi:WD40 repeat protein
MKCPAPNDKSRIARLHRNLTCILACGVALLLVAGSAELHAASAVAKTFYYTTFGASNAAGSGSFSWDGTTLSVTTHEIVVLPGFGIDGSLAVASDGNIYSGRAGAVYQINPLTGVFQSVSSGVNNNVVSIEPTKTTLYVGWKDTPLATVGTGTDFGAGTAHAISGDDTVATGLAFLPDGSVWYTTGGEDQLGNVGTINLSTYTTTRKLASISATAITYDPFTGDIFTAGIDGIVQINPTSGAVVSTWANPQGQGLFIENLAATGTGQLVAFDSSNLLRLWDFSSGSKLIGGAGTIIASAPTSVAAGGLYLANVASNLLNISTRLNVQTGDNVLIGGFIITGSDPKEVLVRGIGPSLDGIIQGALADPTLELHEPDGTIVTNDNWKDTQEQEIIATGIPPTNDLESAIVATLDPGAYTVIMAGKNGGTGVGLVEAYDLDQTAASQLGNISTRGFVETGDNVIIGGFIVGGGGGGDSTIVVRGIGPSLTTAGVTDALQDPMLEVHDSNGAIIASNDNWMNSPDKQTIMDDGLAPTNDKESALLAILAPGAYTAIVSGVNNGTGVALVEVYNVQ